MRRPARVVLAPNAFKGTFDAVTVAESWAAMLTGRTVGGRRIETLLRPMSDGGDGFVAVVGHYRPAFLTVQARVPDPLGRPVVASWGWDPDARAACLESAAAVGLRLVPPAERRPLMADTAGLGRLLTVGAGLGVRRFVIGLGGSATVDGGLGMARALGFRFEDARGRAISRPGDLARLARIAPPAGAPFGTGPRGGALNVSALADVTSPLLGPAGAAAVFGPQKGAGRAAIQRLEAGLTRLAERWTLDLGAPADLALRSGAGAAGGLGGACVACLGARLTSGAAWCARLAGLGPAFRRADLVVTGEGRFDAQSRAGKATGYVVGLARRSAVPSVVVSGGPGEEALTLEELSARALVSIREARAF